MIYLDDLLRAPDFEGAVKALAADYREKHGFGQVHQLGIVVDEVEPAAAELEKRGIGPFFIGAGAPVRWRERGEERKFKGKMGLAYHLGYELELLEPGEGSDFYRRSLAPGGRMVVQHLGFLSPDVDRDSERLTAAGTPVYVRGTIKTGPMFTEFAYMDTEKEAGLVLEFISWRVFGVRFSPAPALIHLIGRLQKLSGKRSISI